MLLLDSSVGTFLVLLVGGQGFGDPLGPGVVGLGARLHPVQHGGELLQVVAIPAAFRHGITPKNTLRRLEYLF